MYFGTYFLGEPSYDAMNRLVNDMSSTDVGAWGRYRLAMFLPTSNYFQPIQIVTHMFMHADFTHLFFNMFGLFMFGPSLEIKWGARRFLFYYLFTGFGALALHLIVRYLELDYTFGTAIVPGANVPMLGASGAIFGILIGYGRSFPNNIIQLIFPPIALPAKYFVLIIAAIEVFQGLGPFNTGIAHFAHLGGALFGFLLILYWERYGSRL